MTTSPEHTKHIAVYPGTFDPITMGHVDIIKRALNLFDELIIAVAINASKQPLFTLQERIDMILEAFPDTSRIRVEAAEGLIVNFANSHKATALVRGIRAVSDFDYEFQMALANRKLNKDVESVFLMPGFRWIYISSSIIKDIARNGGDVSDMVPPHVIAALQRKFHRES